MTNKDKDIEAAIKNSMVDHKMNSKDDMSEEEMLKRAMKESLAMEKQCIKISDA